ncbi:hypothetical protein GO755_37070 [Spirosoma sp. HMF4905]|uniref:DUF4350 domain-containing protein n=1 Tax=Spirosoma arboris TaxID=2682092 RepID=A0A7K1SQ19_9BACT|nr:hypothetical protein [Spirosoma arboris]MVM35686.1 hypothetical protein [Spirosoma arboris]
MTTKKCMLVVSVVLLYSCQASQKADIDYNTSVSAPFYTSNSPQVLFDEAHFNLHTTQGTFKPFVTLITHDGCKVTPNLAPFTADLLDQYSLLIIANAKGGLHDDKAADAFTDKECKSVSDWVKKGGALLLITDHHPFGMAAQKLAAAFGVQMGGGTVNDSANFDKTQLWKDQLEFTKTNKLLAAHPINKGLNRVVTFTGQSLKGDSLAKPILRLGSTATEARPDSIWEADGLTYTRFADPVSVVGWSQALSIDYGAGRVVMLGEAACLSAQVDEKGEKFGMNVPGNDNRQFILNIIHWLTNKAK